MTEKKEDSWKKEIAEIVEQKMKEHQAALLEALKGSNPLSLPKENKEGHATIEEMLECPNCYPKVRDGVTKKEGFIKPIGKRDRHEYEKICKGCGLRGKKEEEKCPSCGSTDYY